MINGFKYLLHLLIFSLIFITGCNPIVDEDEDEDEDVQLYNEDGTKFTGNGKIYLCYNNSEGRVSKCFYANVSDGKYSYDVFELVGRYQEFWNMLEDDKPLFAINEPSGYNNHGILVEIDEICNKVEFEGNNGFFLEERFYNNDNTEEYLLLEKMGEKKDNGSIERVFLSTFVRCYPDIVRYINGELTYKQILTCSSIKEESIVSVKYDLKFKEIDDDGTPSINLILTYTKENYEISLEKENAYNVDITIGLRKDVNFGYMNFRQTLVNKNFRIRR